MPKKDQQKDQQAADRRRWGVPDWRNKAAYPNPGDLSDALWRWEFLRRQPDYRKDWETNWPLTQKLFEQIQSRGGTGQQLNSLCNSGEFQEWREAIALELSLLRDLRGNWDNLGINPDNPASWRALMPGRNLVEKYRLNHGLPNPACQIPEALQFITITEEGYLRPGGLYWFRSRLTPGLWWGHRAFVFDLTTPLDPQLKMARKQLTYGQEVLQKLCNAPQPLEHFKGVRVSIKTRESRNLWPKYLRVADAKGEGLTLLEIYSGIIGDATDHQTHGREYCENKAAYYLKAARRLAF